MLCAVMDIFDGAYGDLPPLSPQAVAEAQRQLGVRLPASLLALLEVRNGGTVAEEHAAFPTTGDDYVELDHVMGIGPPGGALTLLDTPYLVEEWGLPSPVVLLSGDGHTWVALDYRECGPQGEPSVTWFDADRETELRLAPDFASFVAGLRPCPP
jgi:hypothetical protein